jgi:hypothetical protein
MTLIFIVTPFSDLTAPPLVRRAERHVALGLDCQQKPPCRLKRRQRAMTWILSVLGRYTLLKVHSFNRYEMPCLDHQVSVAMRHRRQQQAMVPASR